MFNTLAAADSGTLVGFDVIAIEGVEITWPIGVDDDEFELEDEFEGRNISLSGVGVLDLDEGGLWGGGNDWWLLELLLDMEDGADKFSDISRCLNIKLPVETCSPLLLSMSVFGL